MKDRAVLITGASGGLGLAVTQAALDAGARVTATVLGPQDAQTLRERFGDRIATVEADLREPDSAGPVLAALPEVDVLLHLAGGFGMGDTATFAPQAYRDLVDLNLTTTFVAVQAVLPTMRAAGYGRIVTVASRSAIEPPGQMAIYAASKAAVLAFTQAVADEHRDVDITANSVLPSVIDTPANRAAMGEEQRDAWVTPERLAASILFLGSEAARDLRGSALRAYGRVC